MSAAPEVRPGQLWADNDKRERARGRVLRIQDVGPTHAVAYAWDNGSTEGRFTKVRLDRFKPTSTGYRLIEQSPGVLATPVEAPRTPRESASTGLGGDPGPGGSREVPEQVQVPPTSEARP